MRRVRYSAFVGFLLFAVLLGASAFAQLPPTRTIDAYVQKAMKDWNVPGLALGIVMNDSLVFARGYGVRELGTTKKVNEHTLFAIASNSKAFTAAILAMLVEQGKLRWDDRVVDHVPCFQLYDPYLTREITIRDLLTHRSGLPTFGGDHLWIGNNLSREEIIARLRYLKPTASLRNRYQYQNLMYTVAGYVSEKITGKSWNNLVREWIFEPLGMNESNTSVRELRGLENVALPHETVDGVVRVVEFDSVDAVAPAGAINSNVMDMSCWMRLQLNHGVFRGKRLLKESTVREMHSIQFPLRVSPRDEKYGVRFSGYGLGWRVTEYRRWKVVQHSGGLSGMISLQTLLPEKKIGIIVFTNYAPNYLPRVVTNWLLDHLLGVEPEDWNKIYLERRKRAEQRRAQREEELQKKRVKGTKPSLPLEKYTGVYSNQLSGKARVYLEDGHLVFYYNKRHVGTLEHWHFDTFRVHWRHPIFDMEPKTFLTFRLNEQGEVESLTVRFYHPNTFWKEESGGSNED